MVAFFLKILRLTKPYKVRFALGILCGILSGMFTPALPLTVKLVVEAVFNARTNVPPQIVTQPISQKAAIESNTVTFTVGAIGSAPLSYQWSKDGSPLAGQTTSGLTLVDVTTNDNGLYRVRVSNAVGLADSDPATLAVIYSTGTKPTQSLAKGKKAEAFLRKFLSRFSPSEHPTKSTVVLLIALIPLVMLFRGVLSYLNIYLLCWVAIRAINDLRIRMFEHLMHLPLSFFTRSSTGDLMSRINETGVLQNTITTSVAVIIREPISILALLTVLLVQQTTLTLITLLVLPVCIIPVAVYGRKLRKSSHAIQATASDLSTVMHEAFTGTRIIKAYNLEPTVIDQFKRSSQFAISQYMRMVRASEIPGPLIEFLGATGVALFFLYFAFLAKSEATSADLLQFVISIFLIYPPVKALGRLHSQLELARVAGNRIFQLLETKTTVEEPAQPKPLRASHAAIQFQEIEFSYEKKPVLQNINISIEPGKLVALVGSSGSGKTTLTNLLLRFYDPQRGSVRIGGIDIREVSLRDLRSQIAVVTQETILFNDTIARNIELGRPGATEQEIESAARHAHAYDFIREKPGGFKTRIGEKGVVLSGGERQRLSIARAILKNAPILVLDEATSSLDSESERAVQAALEELMQGRTTICIAHRFSTIHNADLIVVMDQGRVVETGKHSELIHRPGIYQKLHALQFP